MDGVKKDDAMAMSKYKRYLGKKNTHPRDDILVVS